MLVRTRYLRCGRISWLCIAWHQGGCQRLDLKTLPPAMDRGKAAKAAVAHRGEHRTALLCVCNSQLYTVLQQAPRYDRLHSTSHRPRANSKQGRIRPRLHGAVHCIPYSHLKPLRSVSAAPGGGLQPSSVGAEVIAVCVQVNENRAVSLVFSKCTLKTYKAHFKQQLLRQL